MNDLTLVTYSHSDYSDIWPLVIDGMSKIKDINKVFACNTTDDTRLIDIKKVYNTIEFYDNNLTYPQKLVHVLEFISTPYILLIHDIDICINFNIEKMILLMGTIKENKIDRCIFGMVPKQDKIINIDDIALTNLSKQNISRCFLTPYDVGVSIWNVDCLKECMIKYNNVSYRHIESCDIQNYLLTKNIWGFTPTETCRPIFQTGRPYSNYFTFLHILIRGKWFLPHIYMELKNTFIELISYYDIDINKRGIIDGSHVSISDFSV